MSSKKKDGTHRNNEYLVLISDEMKQALLRHIYGRKISTFVAIIVEDYIKTLDSKGEFLKEPFIDSGKKTCRIKPKFSLDIACKIEKERNKEKREKSDFIRYILHVYLQKQETS